VDIQTERHQITFNEAIGAVLKQAGQIVIRSSVLRIYAEDTLRRLQEKEQDHAKNLPQQRRA